MFFKKSNKSKNITSNIPPQPASYKSEIEQITNKLIEETVGESGRLWIQYGKLIDKFNATDNPLGEDEARTMLQTLLLEASSNRRLLSERIAQSVENGAIFEKYSRKMETVNQLHVDVYLAMKKMQTARAEFEDARDKLDKISDSSYSEKFIKSENERREMEKNKFDGILPEAEFEGGEADHEMAKKLS